jgi:hypothetical protein
VVASHPPWGGSATPFFFLPPYFLFLFFLKKGVAEPPHWGWPMGWLATLLSSSSSSSFLIIDLIFKIKLKKLIF